MVHPITLGKNTRMSYAKINEVLEMPNLIGVQKDSYNWFIEEGLKEVFRDVSPITDYTGNLILEFTDYTLDKNNPKYDIEECKERDTNYCAPLRVKVRLIHKDTHEIKEQEIFMGDFPLMTNQGTFIINGAERVIVSQLVRSPGIYYTTQYDKVGKKLLASTVIPNRGAWLEYETDSNDVFYVRVDRQRKMPVTILLRCLGLGTDIDIINMFGEDEKLYATMEKDSTKNEENALFELYRRLRPGEPPTEDSARSLLHAYFFDSRRYDLAKVGRYKFNKKLAIASRIMGHVSAEHIVNPGTGEIIVAAGEIIKREAAFEIEKLGINNVMLLVDDKRIKVFSNNMVDIKNYVSFDISDLKIKEKVVRCVIEDIIENCETEEDIKKAIDLRRDELVPKHITVDDIMASVNYCLNLSYGTGSVDDIDHLGNRRLRGVGELL